MSIESTPKATSLNPWNPEAPSFKTQKEKEKEKEEKEATRKREINKLEDAKKEEAHITASKNATNVVVVNFDDCNRKVVESFNMKFKNDEFLIKLFLRSFTQKQKQQ
jgi:hypothetical protein